VRPTDENQQSTRPNLMASGRRVGNEESILAQLERDAGRRGRRRTPRLTWFFAAGAVAVALAGALLWLHEQSSTELIMVQAPLAVEPGNTIEAGEMPVSPAPHAAGGAQPAMAQAATIVDESQGAAGAPTRHEVPPLVMLTAQQALRPSAAAPAPAQAGPVDQASAAIAREIAPLSATAGTASVPAAALQAGPKHASKAPDARGDGARPRTMAKGASASASTRLASHRTAARRIGKQKKPSAPPPATRAVDSDVALISAVILHASNRANGAEADCGPPEVKCAAKATPEQ
jgi:hypothetical protein